MKRIFGFIIVSAMLIAVGCKKQSNQPAQLRTSSQMKKSTPEELIATRISKANAAAKAKYIALKEKSGEILAEHQVRSANTTVPAKKMNIKVPGDYATIQEAVDNAADGATINVSGSYTENVVIEALSHITINGGGSATLQPTTSSDFPFFIYNSRGITIKGFTLKDGPVYIYRSHQIEIKDNDLSGLGDGIDLVRSDNSSIKNNVVHNKASSYTGSGDGIWLFESNHNTISGNQTSNNDDSGIDLYASSENSIHGNVSNSNLSIGIHLNLDVWITGSMIGCDSNILQDNVVNENFAGILLNSNSTNNVLKGNQAYYNDFGIFLDSYVAPVTGNSISDCITNNNSVGILYFTDHGDAEFLISDNLITGTTINNNNDTGLELQEGSEYNTTKNSTATGNGNCDYTDLGTNNISQDNTFGHLCTTY